MIQHAHRFVLFATVLAMGVWIVAGGYSPPRARAAVSANVTLAAGDSHGCFLRSEGTVWCWGNNDDGQIGDGTTVERSSPVQVPGLSNVVSIAAGNHHTCALLATGAVRCWGLNASGQLGDGTNTLRLTPVPVCLFGSGGACPQLDFISAIAAGDIHTCAMTGTGLVRCWGDNVHGQLGNGTTTASSLPVAAAMPFGELASQIAAGGAHSCAVIPGNVACWGRNNAGQIGDGTLVDKTSAVIVPALGRPVQVAAGDYHTCRLTVSGTVQCWGDNGYGQLGDGQVCGFLCATSQTVSGIFNGTSISTGGAQSCASLGTGNVVCWGRNEYGEIGDGTTVNRSLPVFSTVGSVTAAMSYSTCVLAAGEPLCVGRNDRSQLGAGSLDTCLGTDCSLVYVAPGLMNGQAVAIGAGYAHTCVLQSDSTMRCWGRGDFGQLGNGSFTDSASPIPVCLTGTGPGCAGGTMLYGITSIGVGRYHTCATLYNGTAYCWGLNDFGQIGDGTTTNRSAPAVVSSLSQAVQITAGNSHTCAMTAFNQPHCWGLNATGQLGDGTTTDHLTPEWVCSSGSAPGCGPFGLFTRLSAGGAHSCGIDANLLARCWGWNGFGQIADGTLSDRLVQVQVCASGSGSGCPTLSPFLDLDTGEYNHTCGVLLTGLGACWGGNSDGQLGNGTLVDQSLPVTVGGVGNVVAIATGYAHSCAVLANGTAWCWGDDSSGQLGNDPSLADTSSPVSAFGINNAIEIAAGAKHTCALRGDGTVRCWGENSDGQLGDGTTTDAPESVISSTDSDSDGCTDHEELGLIPSSGGVRNPFEYFDWYDVTGDKTVDLLDTFAILLHFGHGAQADAQDDNLDREIPNPAQSWRTAASETGIDLFDALNNLKQFGHSCAPPP